MSGLDAGARVCNLPAGRALDGSRPPPQQRERDDVGPGQASQDPSCTAVGDGRLRTGAGRGCVRGDGPVEEGVVFLLGALVEEVALLLSGPADLVWDALGMD